MAQDTNWNNSLPPGVMPPVAAPDGAELRRAPRFTLLVRTAKLVVDGREYLCVLRDASATGAKVRLFHAIPPHRTIALETASGQRYPMDLVWSRDDHAGFRFHEDVDVHALIEDRREQYPKRQIRVRVAHEAVLYAQGRPMSVTLRDISQQGACLESGEYLMLRQPVRLEVPGFPEIFGKVCWRQKPRYGLAFETGFSLEEMALDVMRLNALSAPPEPLPAAAVGPARRAV